MLCTWFYEHPYCTDSDILFHFLMTNVLIVSRFWSACASAKCPKCKKTGSECDQDMIHNCRCVPYCLNPCQLDATTLRVCLSTICHRPPLESGPNGVKKIHIILLCDEPSYLRNTTKHKEQKQVLTCTTFPIVSISQCPILNESTLPSFSLSDVNV